MSWTTEQIAAFALRVGEGDLAEPARTRLKASLLDGIGCAIGALGAGPVERVLVVGATALLRQARCGRGRPSPFMAGLLARKPPKLAAVALANKTARIAWKLMVSGERYRRAAA